MPRSLSERLPAALAALAVQAGILALIVLSLVVVRQLPREEETILTLRPPAIPVPPRALVIDGRPRAPLRASAAPPSQTATPSYHPPSSASPSADGDAAILRDLGALTGGVRRPGAGLAQRDPQDVVVPDPHIRDENYWAQERDASQAPPQVPCVSLASRTVGMGPTLSQESAVMVNPLCVIAELADWGNSGKPQYEPRPFDPEAGHASEAAFRQALAAVQTRQYGLSGRPAPGAAP